MGFIAQIKTSRFKRVLRRESRKEGARRKWFDEQGRWRWQLLFR